MERARWRFVGPTYELILVPWGDRGEAQGDALDADAAARALRVLLASQASMGFASLTLADCARHASRAAGLARPTRAEALALVCDALRRGTLSASRAPLRDVAAPASELEPGPRTDAAPAPGPRRTWIEIELTDMEGNPMPRERYWIKLPDGEVREGALDEHGRAYFGDLDPGTAEIRWPARDGDAVMSAPKLGQRALAPQSDGASGRDTEARRERTWIEIELVDMEGAPVPHERYWIRLPDGAVREGALDDQGVAYFDDLDPGECTIRWPDRDREATATLRDITASPAAREEADSEAQAEALITAAAEGVPFCEECERARRQGAQQGASA